MWSQQPLICDVDLPPGQRSLYYQILNSEYEVLRQSVRTYWKTKSKDPFSEDIFHDTIINCVNACCLMTDRSTIYKYVCKSYYTNMLRELDYSYHKCDIPLDMSVHDIFVQDEEFEAFRREIYEYVKKDKGERIANIIHDYVDGYTFDELVAKYHIKNIHKKAGPLREYMRKVIDLWTK